MFCLTAPSDPVTPLKPGPGSRLSGMLKRLGFKVCASCGSMSRKMDREGPQWCRDHIDEILAEMRKNSENSASNPLGIPFVEWAARRMVLHCARE